MINVQENFLPNEIFKQLQHYCGIKEFATVKVGEKDFCVLETPRYLLPHLEIEGHQRILTFIRQAHKDFDTDMRIHADNIIMGHKTSLARVLYITGKGVSDNGTAFWEHHTHGCMLNDDVTNEEFDRLLTEDSNDVSKWKQADYISSRPNRMLTYGSQQFHSKWPAKIEEGTRMVLVCFYTKK